VRFKQNISQLANVLARLTRLTKCPQVTQTPTSALIITGLVNTQLLRISHLYHSACPHKNGPHGSNSAGGQELWNELSGEFNQVKLPVGSTGTQAGGWFNKEMETQMTSKV
jgi:hypothetical protein